MTPTISARLRVSLSVKRLLLVSSEAVDDAESAQLEEYVEEELLEEEQPEEELLLAESLNERRNG